MTGKPRFVARAVEGGGWRIWDHQTKRWVGEPYATRPEEVVAKLNGLQHRSPKLRKLP